MLISNQFCKHSQRCTKLIKALSFISLRYWLTIPLIAVVLGVALTIGASSYKTGSQAVHTISDHLLTETVHRIGQAVDRHLVGSSTIIDAAFPLDIAATSNINDVLPDYRNRMWIATALNTHQNTDPRTQPSRYVYYGNEQGQFTGMLRSNLPQVQLRLKTNAREPRQFYELTGMSTALGVSTLEDKVYDPRTRPWYSAAKQSATPIWTSTYVDFRSKELVKTRARRVLDAQGNFQGVVATDLSMSQLNAFVRTLSLSKNGLAFIIERDGNLVASSRTPNVTKDTSGASILVNASQSEDELQNAVYKKIKPLISASDELTAARTLSFTGPNDETINLAVNRIRDDADLDWFMVVAMPQKDFMQGVDQNVKRSIGIAALASLLAILIGYGVVYWVSRDLRKLTSAAKEIANGKLDTKIEVHRSDEIGVLADAFSDMLKRLRTDKLTQLVNREVIERSIDRRIASARRSKDTSPFAVLFIDLNNFKMVNDQFGHDAGDKALVEIASRFRQTTRADDLVARYAGDEFVILINHVDSVIAAEKVRKDLEARLREPLVSVDLSRLPKHVLTGGSIGMAIFNKASVSSSEMIKEADSDMYERKRSERGAAMDQSALAV